MRTEEVTDGSRLSAATRYESLVGVSNAIGTHRDPQDLFSALVRELHRVIRFDYIGVSIRDEKSNTFHRHSVDAETEIALAPDAELAIEESDAWWVYQNQKPLITSLDARDARPAELILRDDAGLEARPRHRPRAVAALQDLALRRRAFADRFGFRRCAQAAFEEESRFDL